MSTTKDKVKSGGRFETAITKHRSLLTKAERRVIALKKSADQADLECANHAAAVKALGGKTDDLLQRAKAARDAFEAARVELEAQ
jgi:hypothetical protein